VFEKKKTPTIDLKRKINICGVIVLAFSPGGGKVIQHNLLYIMCISNFLKNLNKRAFTFDEYFRFDSRRTI
jgi:hypothetical protein